MRTRTVVATIVAAATVTAGAAGTALAQQSDPSPAAKPGPRAAFVCAHQDEIGDLLAQRQTLLSTRLNLLKEARPAAADARATKRVAQIDRRISRTTDAQAKVKARIDKLPGWVGEHCPG
jgi:hypothetical protein